MIQTLIKKGISFIKNDTVFWVFFILLTLGMIIFVLKKEAVKITITLSEPYGNKVIEIFGN